MLDTIFMNPCRLVLDTLFGQDAQFPYRSLLITLFLLNLCGTCCLIVVFDIQCRCGLNLYKFISCYYQN